VAEDVVTLYGKTYRAVVVHSSHHDRRRQKRLEREVQASSTTLAATVRAAAKQEYFCRADAEAAAEQLRALQSAYHRVEVVIEERPQYGPGRLSPKPPPRAQSAAVWPAGDAPRAGGGRCPQAARGGLFCALDECAHGRGDGA
jgi:hypothetical protein